MKAHSRQAGGGTLFTEPILVVSQQATLVEAGSEFGVFDQHGEPLGSVNWRAWDFSLTDDTGAEIARVTKTFDGPVKEAFTTTDNYVVEVHRHVASPLACMAMAAALTIDTALRQDEPDT